MPLTDTNSTESPANDETGEEKLAWVYAASAVLGLAVTAITLWQWWKKGTI